MALQGYREGSGLIIPQEISIEPPATGGKRTLVTVPDGFFMRWRILHWILTINTGDNTFRQWFVNVISPASGDMGQIIPGTAAVGGTGFPTQTPIHEMLDATSPVFFDEVFNGAAGVQPLWDYSGLSAVWWPPGFKFELDASNLVAGDQFTEVNGIVDLIESETDTSGIVTQGSGASALAYLLHTP